MKHFSLLASFSTALFVVGAPAVAQDMVALHSVTIAANNDVTVVYSKNFATCAHLRSSNAACTTYGPLTHVQNLFCTQGNMVSITQPSTAFTAGFGAGMSVFLVHGNNSTVRSACTTVTCSGTFGIGCAGTTGIPVLAATDACPPAGGSLDLTIANGAIGSLAVLGFGTTQFTFPLFGCNLLIGGLLVTGVVPLDIVGAGNLSLPLPLGSGGFSLTLQAFVLDTGGPQGFSATNGVLVLVQ
ncbi:MAG: hypothetical protein ABIP94_15370 [Planctomycetota bacterium]